MTLAEDVVAAFGQLSVNFSELEEILILQTAKLISPTDPDIGYVTLAGSNFVTIEKIFRALIIERTSLRFSSAKPSMVGRNDEIREKMQDLMKQIAGARVKRNEYIHSHWTAVYTYDEATEDFVHSASADLTRHKMHDRRGYEVSMETRTAAEIQAVAQEINEVKLALFNFVAWTNSFLESPDALFPENDFLPFV